MFLTQFVMDWSDLVQPLLETVLAVMLPIVLGFVAVWLKGLLAKVKAEMSESQLAFVTALAGQLVLAAEQSGLTGAITNVGEEKKAMVLAALQQAATDNGIKINVELLSAIIEAAVVDAFGLSNKSE
jgi:hypothetical protein